MQHQLISYPTPAAKSVLEITSTIMAMTPPIPTMYGLFIVLMTWSSTAAEAFSCEGSGILSCELGFQGSSEDDSEIEEERKMTRAWVRPVGMFASDQV